MKLIIQALVMPAFILTMQLFFKFLFEEDMVGLGISLASVAVAQIFPFIFFDNLIMLKVFKLGSEFSRVDKDLITKYSFIVNRKAENIRTLKNLTILTFIIILTLFFITLGLSFKHDYYLYHYYTGIFSVCISIVYLIFA